MENQKGDIIRKLLPEFLARVDKIDKEIEEEERGLRWPNAKKYPIRSESDRERGLVISGFLKAEITRWLTKAPQWEDWELTEEERKEKFCCSLEWLHKEYWTRGPVTWAQAAFCLRQPNDGKRGEKRERGHPIYGSSGHCLKNCNGCPRADIQEIEKGWADGR